MRPTPRGKTPATLQAEINQLGAVIHRIRPGAKSLRRSIESAPDGIVWIVGRREPETGGGPAVWHIQGVALDEAIAVAMCRDADYFVGPLPINTLLPHNVVEWFGLYWPKKFDRRSDPNPINY